jgi:putative sterol carrier protein
MSDLINFGTEAWLDHLKETLNRSESYAEAAKNWEGDIYFVIEAEGSALLEDLYLYFDLWHGQCRAATLVHDPADYRPEFIFTGNVKTFRQIIDDGLDPMKAIITRKLKLQGNMTKIMRNVKAANQLVHCCTLIPTRFPLEL